MAEQQQAAVHIGVCVKLCEIMGDGLGERGTRPTISV